MARTYKHNSDFHKDDDDVSQRNRRKVKECLKNGEFDEILEDGRPQKQKNAGPSNQKKPMWERVNKRTFDEE